MNTVATLIHILIVSGAWFDSMPDYIKGDQSKDWSFYFGGKEYDI